MMTLCGCSTPALFRRRYLCGSFPGPPALRASLSPLLCSLSPGCRGCVIEAPQSLILSLFSMRTEICTKYLGASWLPCRLSRIVVLGSPRIYDHSSHGFLVKCSTLGKSSTEWILSPMRELFLVIPKMKMPLLYHWVRLTGPVMIVIHRIYS